MYKGDGQNEDQRLEDSGQRMMRITVKSLIPEADMKDQGEQERPEQTLEARADMKAQSGHESPERTLEARASKRGQSGHWRPGQT